MICNGDERMVIFQTKDLQKKMGIGRDKSYALMKAHGFPSTKIGGTFIVTEKALERWLEDNEGREVIL